MNTLNFILSFILILIKMLRPGGMRKVAAENIALRQQLLVVSRKQKRSPKLLTTDRFIFGFLSFFISSTRLSKIAIIVKPATILKFHKALVERKYRSLFSNKIHKKSGPTGPSDELIELVLEMKRRNPSFGSRRIAMQIANSFNINIDKDVVRRILATYFKSSPGSGGSGPSWLSFIGNIKDSLWSVDLFRCESITLTSHWVMVVMDQFTRQIIGFAVHVGNVDGIAVCCMFNKIISQKSLPKYLSSDNDPLFTFHRWKANLRILDVDEIKSVPYVPNSHPYVERLISTVRHELLDKNLFWNERDLQNKLNHFQNYYNNHRCHWGIGGDIPSQKAGQSSNVISMHNYRWKKHCRSLYELPVAA